MSAPTITRQAILRRAAEILQANGRNIETYYDFGQHEDEKVPLDRCRMCTGGALGHAAGVNFTDQWPGFSQSPGVALAVDAGRALIGHLGLRLAPEDVPEDTVFLIIGNWNDAEDRTDEQVIAALNTAADHLDEQETNR